MEWVTRTRIGNQALFELSKSNDFTFTLKGGNWVDPQFFISIKSVTYPKVLKYMKFNIKKLSNILNSYKIETEINGIVEDIVSKSSINGDATIYANGCYGFELDWGGGTRTVSWSECEYDINIKSSDGTVVNVQPMYYYGIYRYDMDLYGGIAYGHTEIENFTSKKSFTIYPTINGSRFSYAYSWNFILKKYIESTYIDDNIVLNVLVVDTVVDTYNTLNKLSSSGWYDISKIHFKSQVLQFSKINKILLNLKNYTKFVSWSKSRVILGATSLFRKNNNGFYNLEMLKKDEQNYEISNKSLAYPERINISSDTKILKYDRNGGTTSSSYSITTLSKITLYIWVSHEVLNQVDNGYFTIEIYNNGLMVSTLDNRYSSNNYIAKSFEYGGDYSWYYSTYVIDVPNSEDGYNNITAKITWNDNSTMSMHVYVNRGSNYINTSKQVVTYNDTLIYAFEENQ